MREATVEVSSKEIINEAKQIVGRFLFFTDNGDGRPTYPSPRLPVVSSAVRISRIQGLNALIKQRSQFMLFFVFRVFRATTRLLVHLITFY